MCYSQIIGLYRFSMRKAEFSLDTASTGRPDSILTRYLVPTCKTELKYLLIPQLRSPVEAIQLTTTMVCSCSSLNPFRYLHLSTWALYSWQGQIYRRQYTNTFTRECLGNHC